MVSLSDDYSHPNGVVFDLPQTAFVMYPALFTSVEGVCKGHLCANGIRRIRFFGALWTDCVTSRHAVAVEAAVFICK